MRISEIQSGLHEENYPKVINNAHGLRSSAGNFQALPIMKLTLEIELYAKQQKKDEIQSLVSRLGKHFLLLAKELNMIKDQYSHENHRRG
jgi:HPt (histidine-containing phosphotransfer) domain-containing protein